MDSEEKTTLQISLLTVNIHVIQSVRIFFIFYFYFWFIVKENPKAVFIRKFGE